MGVGNTAVKEENPGGRLEHENGRRLENESEGEFPGGCLQYERGGREFWRASGTRERREIVLMDGDE